MSALPTRIVASAPALDAVERGSLRANLTAIFKVAEAFPVQPSALFRQRRAASALGQARQELMHAPDARLTNCALGAAEVKEAGTCDEPEATAGKSLCYCIDYE
jgi:hypothetical protein